ncbi:ATP-dependent helicase [Dactylosporangium aurantiacum]|uniref:ATP-dependent helicase n=1 Tax=Dactylosporangium aurantiacum TaxID=35754 RepID=UPI00069322E4|nr:UvrD-helicase domain-containing protein [Dactylosporangium aurantiacum]MDG6104878.1 UvrD-helicase domain-containing protein [Dactylosporangium aurantiacum]
MSVPPRGGGRAVAYTPVELAGLLRQAAPTPQQAAVVAAPVAPLLVVAGAGSGKTETMAARVVWLVANGHARPEQILGLTFTRKAAGELSHRIRQRLGQLVRRLGRDDLIAGEPTVATYHSYAARVVREHGVRAGFEPSTRLLTEAACWQLADAVVRGYDGDMTAVSSAPSTVVDAVLHLAGDLAEHLRAPEDVAAWTGRFFAEVSAKTGKMAKPVRDLLSRQQARLQLLPLIRQYQEKKQLLEAMDFGDQLSRAARVALAHPEVGAVERDRFRVVLLDEYQDTSHAQVVLLRSLFGGGHPVTAVGDPCQSIYGWRGASAGTLERFPAEFPTAAGAPATQLSLTTSWRNRPEILDVANALSAPLRAHGARVAELAPADVLAEPASTATVHCALLDTYADEAAWIADRIVASWRLAAKVAPETFPMDIPVEDRPTTAVLVRTRAQIPALENALRSRGLPVEVVGLGGLLDTPEVRDVVSVLRVLADPAEGAALLRILTGPRWRIGPRDLVALYRRARALAAARRAGPVDDEPALADRLDEAVLVEALDDLGDPDAYSPAGHARFAALGAELRRLRWRLDQPLPDLVADIERATGLDVEVAARPGDAGLARGHLDAFSNIAARFAGESEGATLGAFLAFLAAAENEERGLAPGEVEVVSGAVQILTAHAAKGLEWDVVSVAGLCVDVFPGASNAGDHWLRGLGVLPFPLRGDSDGLPVLDLSAVEDVKGVVRRLEAFTTDWREHDVREERRLAYVAVTRPRRLLLASGYWWGDGVKRARGPSVFLEEIRDRCRSGAGVVDAWAAPPPPDAQNPTADAVPSASWPADPLGARRPLLEAAAGMVRAAAAAIAPAAHPAAGIAPAAHPAAGVEPPDGAVTGAAPSDVAVAGPAPSDDVAAAGPVPADGGAVAVPTPRPDDTGAPARVAWPEEVLRDGSGRRWAAEADLLLAERARLTPQLNAPVDVALPGHLSVSQLVALRRDPQRLARALRRPLPSRPDPYARRGTAFHHWLEQRFKAERLIDLDELPGAADEGAAPDEALADLQERFLAGEWADRVPLDVEVPFASVIAGVVVRGRMDAVYAYPDGRYDVVDWKTGAQPSGADATAAAVQLAAYRLAWAELKGVPLDLVGAAFFYVRDGVTVRPADLLDEAGLLALIASLPV